MLFQIGSLPQGNCGDKCAHCEWIVLKSALYLKCNVIICEPFFVTSSSLKSSKRDSVVSKCITIFKLKNFHICFFFPFLSEENRMSTFKRLKTGFPVIL